MSKARGVFSDMTSEGLGEMFEGDIAENYFHPIRGLGLTSA
jgi:hypothetical protein